MSENAIVVTNLSKKYLLGHRKPGGDVHDRTVLRDVLARSFRNFARKAADMARGRQIVQGDEIEEFWAVKDVNFEVKEGEVLGIVGRNGAGKSTLLKILSRITEPTQGRVELRGRVSSLLEIGTGFHGELTGRENIFLNGAILGMTQKEIRKKFDEIVAFADIERFLDTPVKFYSSGMYVRLAFAVAAHLEPEILIVDEVLAVGDIEFQKKCLGKMNEVSRTKGRTILFVSHNMEAIMTLCTRGMYFEAGQLRISGDPQTAVAAYLQSQAASPRIVDLAGKTRRFDYSQRARLIRISPSEATTNWSIPFGQQLSFDLSIDVGSSLASVDFLVGIHSMRGFEVATWTNRSSNIQLRVRPGLNTVRVTFEHLRFLPGQYFLSINILSHRGAEDGLQEAVHFDVVPTTDTADLQNLGGAIAPSASVSVLDHIEIQAKTAS